MARPSPDAAPVTMQTLLRRRCPDSKVGSDMAFWFLLRGFGSKKALGVAKKQKVDYSDEKKDGKKNVRGDLHRCVGWFECCPISSPSQVDALPR